MIQLYSHKQSNNSTLPNENGILEFLKRHDQPGVLLKTCHRTEFYKGEGEIPDHIIRHLFRVVSGLESGLIGEIAIQGQVKMAYLEASQKFPLSKSFHQLFQTALKVGKDVRTNSGISKGAMSHSQAVVELLTRKNIPLNNSIISFIGAHKLNEDIIHYLKNKGAETIFLANKSFDKAESLARKFNCQAMRLDQLPQMLQFSDILITATSAPHLIVKYENFPRDRKMILIDLASPGDVDERIAQFEQVTLWNLEHIESQVNQNLEKRQTEIALAESIIENEINKFKTRLQTGALKINEDNTCLNVTIPSKDELIITKEILSIIFPAQKYHLTVAKSSDFFLNSNSPSSFIPENKESINVMVTGASDLPYPLPKEFEILAVIDPNQILSIYAQTTNSESEATYLNQLLIVFAEKKSIKLHSVLKKFDLRKKWGSVKLVGFGPGDPELLTIKGLKALKKAEVILYDDLTNHTYLAQFKAEKVYVGKRKNKHSSTQESIHELLADYAYQGKQVVRLKGGDPMIFAHGGEEIEYLRRRFINVEIIPGITTALAAASSTSVSLTHRGISSKVTFLTGHDPENIDLPKSGTIVLYMGGSNIVSISHKMLMGGWNPETPVLFTYNVSLSNQEEFRSTLGKIIVDPPIYKSPVIIIIGEVVDLQFKSDDVNLFRLPETTIMENTIYDNQMSMIHS